MLVAEPVTLREQGAGRIGGYVKPWIRDKGTRVVPKDSNHEVEERIL